MFMDSKTIQDLFWSKIDTTLKNGENGQFWTRTIVGHIMITARIIMMRTVIIFTLTTIMVLITVIRTIMNIENDGDDDKKNQQATVDNNLAGIR